MFSHTKFIFFLSCFIFFREPVVYGQDVQSWLEKKSEHFIVCYEDSKDEALAQRFLLSAERYYGQISHVVGFNQSNSFWTWENRVLILIYSDQKTFMTKTGQPVWSRGGAVHHQELLRQKVIVTFSQDNEFIDGILPHEISHLVLDAVVSNKEIVPIWFEEGWAQLYEPRKKERVRRLMPGLVHSQKVLDIETLHNFNVYQEKDVQIASIFYAQSLSMIDFIIRAYGEQKFTMLCRFLRDGIELESAFKKTYGDEFEDLKNFEKKWLRYVTND